METTIKIAMGTQFAQDGTCERGSKQKLVEVADAVRKRIIVIKSGRVKYGAVLDVAL